VALRRPAPGTPTTEALERLRAATQHARTPAERAAQTRHVPTAHEKSRFGINSLINRMTGHAEGAPTATPRQQPPVRRAQSAAPQPGHDDDQDQERIEIPAFLRRQAN
jgi:cell division protein FtsZ